MEYLEIILKTLQLVVSVLVVYIAWKALNTWKKEFIGKKKIELARDIVSKTGKLIDLIKYARDLNSKAVEVKDILEDLKLAKLKDKNISIKEELIFYLVPNHRLRVHNEEIMSLLNLKYEADIYWGKDAAILFDSLSQIVNNIRITSAYLYRFVNTKNILEKEISDRENIIWATDDDEISQKLKKVYKELKQNLEPYYKDNRDSWKKF